MTKRSEVRIVNPLEIPDWDDLISSHPNCSFFHSTAWARVLSESYGYKPLYFTIFEGKAISACLPVMEVDSFITGKRGVSLPFSDYCDPILTEEVDFRELFGSVIDHGKKAGWKYIEVRGGRRLFGNAGPSATYVGHRLDLADGPEMLFSRFRDSTQRNIKKAEKAGVKASISNSSDAVREFCRLNSISRRRHGLPPQPPRFFKAIHRHVISKGSGFVVLASHGRDTIAGSIFFLFQRKALYKYGASDFREQRLRSNNLVMWEAIKWLSQNGFETLSFGRTEPEHAGLLQFKAGWRPTERRIAYYRRNMDSGTFANSSRAASRAQHLFFGRLPIPLLNLIGSLAYRHMG